jgi:ferric-dicitrate binding protein FerR (iron transport regulator)
MTLQGSGSGKAETDTAPTSADIATAAVWLTILQRPEQSARVEAAFGQWLAARRAHLRAFMAVVRTWKDSGSLRR